MAIETMPMARGAKPAKDELKAALIFPAIAFAVASATVAFMPGHTRGSSLDAYRDAVGSAAMAARSSSLAMPAHLAIPTPQRPPIPTFSSFVDALAQAAPPALAAEVKSEFAKDPQLAQTWNEYAHDPDAPAEDFVGKIASLPGFRKLVSHFRNEPGFMSAFAQVARQPIVDSVLKAALLPRLASARVASGVGAGRNVSAITRGLRGDGAGFGAGPQGFASATSPSMAPVADVREWRAVGPGDPTAIAGVDPASQLADGGAGLALDAVPQLLSSPSDPIPPDQKSITQTQTTTTDPTPPVSGHRGNDMVAGALAGAATGAMAGAAIGSVVPGIGTAAGAVVGAVVMGAVGAGVGSLFHHHIHLPW